MPKVVRSTIIDVPVDRLWAVVRDFNAHDQYHPIVATSLIERGYPVDKVGCVRRFTLQDGNELREQLLSLSDLEMTSAIACWIRRSPSSTTSRTYACCR